jgi:hypothetical protein
LDVAAEKKACGVFLSGLQNAGVEFVLVRGETRDGDRKPKAAVWIWKKEVVNPYKRELAAKCESVKTLFRVRNDRKRNPARAVARVAERMATQKGRKQKGVCA